MATGRGAYRQVQTAENHRQRQLCQGETGKARSDGEGGGNQNHRQDTAECVLAAEAVPGGRFYLPLSWLLNRVN